MSGTVPSRPQAASKLLQQTERVIITEWRLTPGAETGWHRHAHDYVVVCLTAGTLLAETANGNVETALASGQSYARPEGVEHNIVNPGETEFESIQAQHSPDGYNIGVNVGKAGGQSRMHVHVHLIPRYAGDVADPRGGIRCVLSAGKPAA